MQAALLLLGAAPPARTCVHFRDPGVAAVPPPRRLDHLWWLHVPKCGRRVPRLRHAAWRRCSRRAAHSSIGTTVLRHLCPKLPPGDGLPAIGNLSRRELRKYGEGVVGPFLERRGLVSAGTKPVRRTRLTTAQRLTSPQGRLPVDRALPYGCNATRQARTADGLRVLWGHPPVPPSLRGSGTGMAMFRAPGARIRSAFAHNRHCAGLTRRWKKRMDEAAPATARAFARLAPVLGCTTKMLLGRKCCSADMPTADEAAAAAASLEDTFAFVGLAEHWELSICLFHAMFGGELDVAELRNTRCDRAPRCPCHAPAHPLRPACRPGEACVHRALAAGEQVPDDVDPLDRAVYARAEALFFSRLKAYGFKLPS